MEEFGMKIWLTARLKNIKEIVKEMEDKFGSIKIKGIAEKAVGLGGFAKPALIVGAAYAALKILGKIWATLKESSPYLQGIMKMFKVATMMFFRPFGDALAYFLKPMAMAMIKLAAWWMKSTKTGRVGRAMAKGEGIFSNPDPETQWTDILTKKIEEIGWKGLGDKIWDKIKSAWNWTKDVGGWLWEQIVAIWNYRDDLGAWLWDKIKTIWNYAQDFGSWLWVKLKSVWNYVQDFGGWIWGKLKTVWSWVHNFGDWFWGKVTSIWQWTWDLGEYLWVKIKKVIDDAIRWAKSKFGFGSNEEPHATGIDYVPETGMYKLHRGEKVVPASRSSGGAVVYNTFNFSGNVSHELDIESVIRRGARAIEMDLRSRGLA